jgi:hypothetical protein
LAVTLQTIKSETQERLQESATSPNSLFKDSDYLGWYNQWCDKYEDRMQLQGGPVTVTLAAGATTIPLTTIGTDVLEIRSIEVLNSDGKVSGEVQPRPRGSSSGYFIWGDTIRFNTDASTTTTTLQVWYFRKATRATVISANVDIHSGSERDVLIPWNMAQANLKNKKPATAQGFLSMAEDAFRSMMRKRNRQANPASETLTVSDAYGPMTG